MDAIQLWFRGEVIREFVLDDHPLEVGRASYCDIVVHDVGVADRQFALRAEGGTVMAYDLRSDPQRPPRTVFSRERPIRLGEHHSIVRVDAHALVEDGATEAIRREPEGRSPYFVAVGRGADRRRFAIGGAPLVIGSAPTAGVVLHDRSVSAHHVRFDRTDAGVAIRDLGSRNGTHVDGVLTHRAEVARGATVRIGRTELFIERDEPDESPGIVVRSSAMREVIAFVDRVARMPFPVLLLGQSGVGKEALARRIHESSLRAKGPYVAINAAAVSRDLIESQLFGHERGAFTGAAVRHRGVFHQADGGTLFLDEIGELPLELQPRLLRVLETMEVRRIGAEATERVDVRIVCATHRDLRAMVQRNEFRRDLYFRIAHLPVAIPPLHARPDDIVPIARAMLIAERAAIGSRHLSSRAERVLESHSWPGNVRELRNILISAAAWTTSAEIGDDVVREVLARSVATSADAPLPEDAFERTLRVHHGNVSAAARVLGVPRTTLRDWARRHPGVSAHDE